MPAAILTAQQWEITLHSEETPLPLRVLMDERTEPPTVNVVAAFRFRPKNVALLRRAIAEMKQGRRPGWVELAKGYPDSERNVWALEQGIKLLNGALTE